ncbi:hypothetical protein FIBSPDRAFT_287413 [Athelia psychrophila]|uniref:Uncharacterized protein n=1 Tax=Athelia psychrophila TaxID=1759441 RepID=A0A167XN61_9AGAM|nr:hypothetical protein FIBSPDRAFT_287413 [Fibularhizoctonia sp. CBS 109695]
MVGGVSESVKRPSCRCPVNILPPQISPFVLRLLLLALFLPLLPHMLLGEDRAAYTSDVCAASHLSHGAGRTRVQTAQYAVSPIACRHGLPRPGPVHHTRLRPFIGKDRGELNVYDVHPGSGMCAERYVRLRKSGVRGEDGEDPEVEVLFRHV